MTAVKTLAGLIDFVYPRRCPICHEIVAERGSLICPGCAGKTKHVTDPYCIRCGKPLRDSSKIRCSGCEGMDLFFKESRAVFVYDDILKNSIYKFKYGGRKEYACYYAEEIFSCLYTKIKTWNPEVIVPIPIHKSKLRKRGYNQTYLIAKRLSHLTGIPVDNQLLIRTKKTEIQKNLSGLERSDNIKNAFKIGSNRVQYLSAMLIDDIYTTGATMNSSAKVLFDSGIRDIYCISLSIGYDV